MRINVMVVDAMNVEPRAGMLRTNIAGELDGDGRSDDTIWRSIGVFYTLGSNGTTSSATWGVAGDLPIGRPPGT